MDRPAPTRSATLADTLKPRGRQSTRTDWEHNWTWPWPPAATSRHELRADRRGPHSSSSSRVRCGSSASPASCADVPTTAAAPAAATPSPPGRSLVSGRPRRALPPSTRDLETDPRAVRALFEAIDDATPADPTPEYKRLGPRGAETRSTDWRRARSRQRPEAQAAAVVSAHTGLFGARCGAPGGGATNPQAVVLLARPRSRSFPSALPTARSTADVTRRPWLAALLGYLVSVRLGGQEWRAFYIRQIGSWTTFPVRDPVRRARACDAARTAAVRILVGAAAGPRRRARHRARPRGRRRRAAARDRHASRRFATPGACPRALRCSTSTNTRELSRRAHRGPPPPSGPVVSLRRAPARLRRTATSSLLEPPHAEILAVASLRPPPPGPQCPRAALRYSPRHPAAPGRARLDADYHGSPPLLSCCNPAHPCTAGLRARRPLERCAPVGTRRRRASSA